MGNTLSYFPRGACLAFPTQNTHGYEIAHLGALGWVRLAPKRSQTVLICCKRFAKQSSSQFLVKMCEWEEG
ncbi:MAG TPA: hypothetical protein V6C91_16415 [Coleofasciculaceae cyanobacterium]